MNVLLLLDDGWEPRRVARALYIDDGTVAEHRRRYAVEGRAGVERLDYHGRACLMDETQQRALAAHVEARVPLTSREVCAWVEHAFGLAYTPNAMTKLLKAARLCSQEAEMRAGQGRRDGPAALRGRDTGAADASGK